MNGGWAGPPPRHRARAAGSGSPSPRGAQARCAEWGGKRSARAGRAGAERAAGVRGEGEAAAPSADSEQRADSAAPCTGTSPPPSPPPAASGPAAPGPRQPPRRRPGRPRRAAATERGRRTWSPPWARARPWRCCPPRAAPRSPPGGGCRGWGARSPRWTGGARTTSTCGTPPGGRLLLGPPPGPGTPAPGAPGPGSPGPGRGGSPRSPPSMEELLASMHERLRHELPNFFLKIPDYALYAPDVEFQCQHLHLHTRGRAMYAVAVALCRALAWGYFASLRLEVLALTRHPEDWSVRARWRLTGLPLHLLLLRWYRRDKRTLLRSYDALSTFFLNSQGLIRCHRVDKLMPAPTAVPEPKKLLVAAALAVALARP
ncbi:uncharacterized protein C6orf136 homolog [Passer domesticus]|uniref:uncharacterized protein C6orf136 homolog n=1 Tax=Passer domesticus TaxID=48849 RepID=UPI0030FE0B6F